MPQLLEIKAAFTLARQEPSNFYKAVTLQKQQLSDVVWAWRRSLCLIIDLILLSAL
jgi:hypothetical protein